MQKYNGFTLVEISLVITIIGLIIAAISAGASLVQSSRIRSQISDFRKYETAFNVFHMEYNAIPGDMLDAGSYWTGTPGGNGDDKLPDYIKINAETENYLFFEHLQKARLIQGSFDASFPNNIDKGFARTKLDPDKGMTSGSGLMCCGGFAWSQQVSTEEAQKTLRHHASLFLAIGRPNIANTGKAGQIGIASPSVMKAVDTKIDDGVARTGIFEAFRPDSSTQGDCLDAQDGDYLITNTQPSCHAQFVLYK